MVVVWYKVKEWTNEWWWNNGSVRTDDDDREGAVLSTRAVFRAGDVADDVGHVDAGHARHCVRSGRDVDVRPPRVAGNRRDRGAVHRPRVLRRGGLVDFVVAREGDGRRLRYDDGVVLAPRAVQRFHRHVRTLCGTTQTRTERV